MTRAVAQEGALSRYRRFPPERL